VFCWEDLVDAILDAIVNVVDFLRFFWVCPGADNLDLDSEFVE